MDKKTRELIKAAAELKEGETIFINAINGTYQSTAELRRMIQTGYIKPVEKELRKAVKPEAFEKFMNGECIAPQMIYRKE